MLSNNQTPVTSLSQLGTGVKKKVARREDGRVVGTVQNGRFFKRIRGSKHILRCADAIGIDVSIFNGMILPSCKEIVCEDSEDNKSYRIGVETFIRHAFMRNFGHSDQLFCPRKHWDTFDSQQLDLFAA